MFQSVKQLFGGHNRAPTQTNRAHAQMRFFSLKFAINEILGFQVLNLQI